MLPHAARVAIDDMLQARHAVADAEQLVDLLLVLGDHCPGAGESQQVGDLVLQRVAVDTKRLRADRMRGDLAHDPVRAVVADEADDVTGAEAELAQTERDGSRPRLVLRPGDAAPDAEFLLPQRHFARESTGVAAQQLRQGIGVAHAITGSSASRTTSSASPR